MADEAVRISSGKNRAVQVVREGTRKRFDARRKALFLEWFAATCNVLLSAEKAGVAYQTVFKHRMRDPAFAAAWNEAVQQGYARIEAELVQAATQAPPIKLAGDLDPVAEGAPTPDKQLMMDLLKANRERLRLAEARDKGGAPRGGRPADEAELRAALVRRLVVFGIRVRGE